MKRLFFSEGKERPHYEEAFFAYECRQNSGLGRFAPSALPNDVNRALYCCTTPCGSSCMYSIRTYESSCSEM